MTSTCLTMKSILSTAHPEYTINSTFKDTQIIFKGIPLNCRSHDERAGKT